jgi:hypothetical protein
MLSVDDNGHQQDQQDLPSGITAQETRTSTRPTLPYGRYTSVNSFAITVVFISMRSEL